MAKVVTFINEKGGLGKTSICYNVAWELSRKKKILMIDLDGQRANLTFFAGVKKSTDTLTIHEILLKDVPVEQAIVEVKKNLRLIPATTDVTNLSQSAKISRFRACLKEMGTEYDYIFIDVTPSPGWGHVLSLATSDFVVIPMLADVATLEANKGIAESILEIKDEMNPNLKVLGLLFNKYNPRTNLSKQVFEIAEDMAKSLDSIVFKTRIRNAVVLSENVAEHIGITEYAPNSAACEDYMAFIKEFEKGVKKHG